MEEESEGSRKIKSDVGANMATRRLLRASSNGHSGVIISSPQLAPLSSAWRGGIRKQRSLYEFPEAWATPQFFITIYLFT